MWYTAVFKFTSVSLSKIEVKVKLNNQRVYVTDQKLCRCGVYYPSYIAIDHTSYVCHFVGKNNVELESSYDIENNVQGLETFVLNLSIRHNQSTTLLNHILVPVFEDYNIRAQNEYKICHICICSSRSSN